MRRETVVTVTHEFAPPSDDAASDTRNDAFCWQDARAVRVHRAQAARRLLLLSACHVEAMSGFMSNVLIRLAAAILLRRTAFADVQVPPIRWQLQVVFLSFEQLNDQCATTQPVILIACSPVKYKPD